MRVILDGMVTEAEPETFSVSRCDRPSVKTKAGIFPTLPQCEVFTGAVSWQDTYCI
jgi:hypothetical protein